MPELPDVEGFRRVLSEHGAGRRIERVRVLDDGVLRDTTPQGLGRALSGQRFGEPGRVGKWLLGYTDGPTVLLHFGMTGQLLWCPQQAEGHRHDRVAFQLDDGELRYRDMRKLQGLRLATDEAALRAVVDDQGRDALAMTRDDLEKLLTRSGRQLKALLSDQSAVAGLGNITIDEILWRARVFPIRKASELGSGERERLFAEMWRVLDESVPAGQVPSYASWLTGARDDAPGAPCPRCGAALAKERMGGRSTVYCPQCQPAACG